MNNKTKERIITCLIFRRHFTRNFVYKYFYKYLKTNARLKHSKKQRQR